MPRIANPVVRRCPWKQDRWIIDGLRDDQGKRFRRFFESKETAKAWLSDHRERSLIEGRDGLALTDSQRADAKRALLELAPFKGVSLSDAARHYADFLLRTERTIPIAELVALFLKAKKADGRSDRYLADLHFRLSGFAKSFGERPTAGISTRDLDDWLRALPQGPQSRVNYRRVLNALFNFASAMGFASENPVAKTQKPKVLQKEPGILTPNQFERLLNAADNRIRPTLAISGFAGLRPAEVSRLTWDAINLEERLISVSAKTSKTASRRFVPISENLLAWLLPVPLKKGRVSLAKVNEERELIVNAREVAEIAVWPSDALRHSWATYRFALTGDAARTASEAGHDQAVLHRHYRALASRADAERWFAIQPIQPGVPSEKPIAFEPLAVRA